MFFSPIFHVPVNEANILKTSFCFNVFEIHFVCIHIAPILSHIRRRKWQPTPLLLPGKSQGRRSPVSCSPWGRYEPDTTEGLHFHFLLSCIGGGNGNPLQCSCLENPGTEEPGRLQSMGSLRVGHDWATSLSLFTFMHWRKKWQPTRALAWRIQGQRSLVGCCLWGRTESDTTEVT